MADDGVIAEFQNITGCDVERAKFYLESANMQLDLALSNFFEGDGMDMDGPLPPEEPQGEEVAAPPPAGAGSGPGAGAPAGFNFGMMNAAGNDDEGDSDSEDEGQAFYAGGSSSSGNVILGPGKKKDKDIVGKLFRKAREAGAEEVRPGEAGGSSGVRAFQGGGFTLGSDTVESAAVGGAAAPPPEPRRFLLKMWQDGFSIDDGELREYNDQQNREFLAAIMKGTIPNELVKEAKGGEVHVDMEDHRQEEYVKPKVKAKPFAGAGHVLGSIAPQVSVPTASSSDPAQAEANAKSQAKVDEGQPATNIQVRLANGSRLIVRLNLTHTVADLRSYICTARPEFASTPFSLQTTFPNKELTEESQSIKEAGLQGAAVLQRLK